MNKMSGWYQMVNMPVCIIWMGEEFFIIGGLVSMVSTRVPIKGMGKEFFIGLVEFVDVATFHIALGRSGPGKRCAASATEDPRAGRPSQVRHDNLLRQRLVHRAYTFPARRLSG